MMRQTFIIELLEDCVFSAHAATEGGHESLDRITGSALLGAAAARLYAGMDRREAFLAFHSGKLRFGDGLPWNGRSVGYPVPLAWHHRKSERPHNGGRLAGDRLFNFLHGVIPRDGEREDQPKQLRAGYVHPGGAYSKPRRGLRLKTAIDATTGRAAEGQLFGYDALARGQRFAAAIEADGDLDPALLERVVDVLQGEVLLGRSRSAEYGRAWVEPADIAAPAPGPAAGNRLTLWLLSDLALCDGTAQPTLSPDVEALGLPSGTQIVWDKTFLRARRYSPWNAARHGFDRERLVLAAGGVVTLDHLPAAPDSSTIERLQRGLGLYREAGLGRVWVNPPLLSNKQPTFDSTQAEDSSAVPPAKPDHPLIAWLEAQTGDWKTEAEASAAEIAEAYREAAKSARRAAGVADGVSFAPSKSQWGRVLEAACTRAGEALFAALFEGDSAVVKTTAEGWNIEVPPRDGEEWITLARWLEARLAFDGSDGRAYAHRVRRLAHRVRNDIEKRRV